MNTPQADSSHERQLDEIVTAYLKAVDAGEKPDRREWQDRYPDFADDLAAFFQAQSQVDRVAAPLRPQNPTEMETVTAASAPTASPELSDLGAIGYFGDYELLSVIAQGGMGVVYRAKQTSLQRIVAIKMILAGKLASEADVQRFRTEAEAAANLDHPNIVPIFEVGEHQGRHYFSMKFIEGGSLTEKMAALKESPRQAAGLLSLAARAVHHAHQRGILHRDLKPGNILIDSHGQPHITDFGLAKRTETDCEQTRTGAIVGTPSYMAPEQAQANKSLTTSVDVYSLGAILYEMLAGRPPFRGETVMQTLLQVSQREPDRPRHVNPRADRDLETICLKCLEKDPKKRYSSADALADDLDRWLRGEPIQARPSSAWERTTKWAKRRPAIAGLLAAVVTVAAVGIAGIIWQWQAARAAESSAIQSEKNAQDKAAAEEIAKNAALKAQQEEADARRKEANAKNEAIAAQLLEAAANKAAGAAQRNAVAALDKEADARKQAEADRDAKNLALIRADGLRLAAEADAARFRDPGLALLLAIEGAKRTPSHLTFTSLYGALRDCREILALGDGGREQRGWHIYQGDLKVARFFPDGKRILTAAGASLRIYDSVTGKVLQEWPGYNLPIDTAELSPDGSKVVLTGHGYSNMLHSDGKPYNYTDRLAYVIDLSTGKEIHRLRGSEFTVVEAHFSPDGKHILTASWDGAARLYDVTTGKQLQTMRAGAKSGAKSLKLARFTPDGKQILTVTANVNSSSYGYDWSANFEAQVKPGIDPEYDPEAAPLGPSGSGSGSFSLRGDAESTIAYLWNAETGKQAASYYKPPPGLLKFGHVWLPQAADISPNGALVAIAFENEATLYEAKTGAFRCNLKGHEGIVSAIAFSPNGKLVATAGADKTIRLWVVKSGQETLRLRGHEKEVSGVEFDREGKRLLSRSADGTARVWQVDSGVEEAILRGHRQHVAAAGFSPDGKRVVTAGDQTARIWTIGAPTMPDTNLAGHKDKITALDYSPNGELVVTVSPDQTARIWDAATGQELRALGTGRDIGPVKMARFSPDGKHIITASANSTSQVGKVVTPSSVVVWDVETGDPTLTLNELETGATAAFFSPTGERILTIGDGYKRINRSSSPPKDPEKKDAKDPKKDAPKEIDVGIKIGLESGSTVDAGRIQIWDAKTRKLLGTMPGKKNSSGFVINNERDLAQFCPDGARLLSYSTETRVARLVDPVTGKTLVEYPSSSRRWGQTHVQISPNGRLVFLANAEQVTVFDAESARQLYRFKDFPGQVGHLAASADGKRLVVTSGGQAHVWDLPSRKLLTTLRGHEGDIKTVAINVDGSQVLTGSQDTTAALWDTATGKMLALYRGHSGAITQVAFRSDGKQVATVGEDGSARLWPVDLWSVVLARRTRELTVPERERYELVVAKDQGQRWQDRIPQADPPAGVVGPEPFAFPKEPLNAALEQKVEGEFQELQRQWEQAPKEIDSLRHKLIDFQRAYPATNASVAAARLTERMPGPLAQLDPAKIPASEKQDGQPKELAAVLGEHRRKAWSGIETVDISDSGRVIAAVANYRNQTFVWNAGTLAPTGQLAGTLLGFVSGRDSIMVRENQTVRIWDVSGEKPIQTAEYPLPAATHVSAVSPDGRLAVCDAFQRQEILLWQLGGNQGAAPIVLMKSNGYGGIHAVFSPDSKRVGVSMQADKTIYVFDLDAKTARKRAEVKVDVVRDAYELGYRFHDQLLVVPMEKTVRCWDLRGEQPKVHFELKNLARYLRGAEFSGDGQSLYVCAASEPIRVFDLKSNPPKEREKLQFKGGQAFSTYGGFSVSRDGKQIALADLTAVRIWERQGDAFHEREPLKGHLGGVGSLDFSADDSLLASTDGSDVRLWVWQDGIGIERNLIPDSAWRVLFMPNGKDLLLSRFQFALWDISGPQPVQKFKPMDGHSHGPVDQSIRADGKLIARGSWRPALSLVDLSEPQPKIRFAIDRINNTELGAVATLSLSPDGRFLATAPMDHNVEEEDIVRMWKVTEKGLVPLAFPWVKADHVRFSPDGKTLATANHGGITLWDLTASPPRERSKLASFGQWERLEFRFNDSGDRLASWAGSHLAVWDTATAKQLHVWQWPGTIESAAFSHDGKHLAVGNANGTIYVLRLPK